MVSRFFNKPWNDWSPEQCYVHRRIKIFPKRNNFMQYFVHSLKTFLGAIIPTLRDIPLHHNSVFVRHSHWHSFLDFFKLTEYLSQWTCLIFILLSSIYVYRKVIYTTQLPISFRLHIPNTKIVSTENIDQIERTLSSKPVFKYQMYLTLCALKTNTGNFI